MYDSYCFIALVPGQIGFLSHVVECVSALFPRCQTGLPKLPRWLPKGDRSPNSPSLGIYWHAWHLQSLERGSAGYWLCFEEVLVLEMTRMIDKFAMH